MNEIYWITRLDGINTFTQTILVISTVISVVSIFAYLGTNNSYDDTDKFIHKFSLKVFKFSFPSIFIFSALNIFTPTTNEAYLIYGVGGTIDYIKNDSIATQIPHKAIVALDNWVDNLNKDDDKH